MNILTWEKRGVNLRVGTEVLRGFRNERILTATRDSESFQWCSLGEAWKTGLMETAPALRDHDWVSLTKTQENILDS